MTRTEIGPEDWNRQHLFESYMGTDFPYINIGCDLDITELYEYKKEKGISLYFSLIYLATKAANSIENFHYRFQDGKPFRIDENVAFATHLQKDNDIFVMVECDAYDDICSFAKKNREKAEIPAKDSGLAAMKGRMDILNFTCIPWIHYNHFVRTIAHDGLDCNPKLSMGKYEKKDGRVLIPFSVQVHHGLMDGLHVGRFFEKLQSLCQEHT